MEGLLQDCGGVLRLAVVSRETLLHCAAAALSGFGLFCGVSVARGHGVLLASM